MLLQRSISLLWAEMMLIHAQSQLRVYVGVQLRLAMVMGYLSDLPGLILLRLVVRWSREDSVYITDLNLVVFRVEIVNTLAVKVGYLNRDILILNKQESLYKISTTFFAVALAMLSFRFLFLGT